MKGPYISPNLWFSTSFEEMESRRDEAQYLSLFEGKKRRAAREAFDEVLSTRKALILSEPGYGKTRFLQELREYAKKEKNFNTVFIELRLYSGEKSIEEYIYDQNKYELKDDAKVILCFDGLDEVKQDCLHSVVSRLRCILDSFPKTLFFLSCRLFYYRKFPVFSDVKFTNVCLENFVFDQVREYLDLIEGSNHQKLFSTGDIDKIIQDFEEPNWESIILIPRYLEKFVEFHRKYPNDKPSKSDLYNFFVNERLNIEDKKRSAQDGVIIRRLLEKIALIMEIYQDNNIKKDHIITILEDIQSNMTGNFLDIGKLQILFDHTLWIDYGETIAFEDHSLQEYLASCELLRLGGQKFLYDMVVDRELNEIHPSWFNALGFIVDQDVNLLEPLVDFGKKDAEKVVESEEYFRFLTRVNTSKLSKSQKIRIFEKVFRQYQREQIWIKWDIAKRLAAFYDSSLNKCLKDYVLDENLKGYSDIRKCVLKGNVSVIVGFLIRQNALDDTEKKWWKERLIAYANDDNENGVLQRDALSALGGLKDKSIINEVQKAFIHPSELVRDGFIDFCLETQPNHETSLKYFIEGTKQRSIYARYGLSSITEKDILRKMFTALSQDEQFLKMFVEGESAYRGEDAKIIETLVRCYDGDFKDILIKIVFKLVGLFEQNSVLVKNIARVLKRFEPNIVEIICREIKKDEAGEKILFEFETFLSIVLTKEKVTFFVECFKENENFRWTLYGTLYTAKETRGAEGLSIYEEGRKYLETLYAENEKRREELAKKTSEKESLHQKFHFKLSLEQGKYMPDVFKFFLNNFEKISDLITKDEMDRLKVLTENVLKTNTKDLMFKVIKWDEEKKNIRSFQWSSIIPLFQDCLRVAEKVSLDINPTIKENIINFIPFAYEGLESIFNILGKIELSELKEVINVYQSDSEKKYFRPINFVRLVGEKHLTEAVPILISFIEDDKLQRHERRESLRVKESLAPNAEHLKEVFGKFLAKDMALAEISNGILIENYSDKDAIEWRLKEIRGRKFKTAELTGVRAIGADEAELFEKDFLKPLIKLSDPTYLPNFMDLLKFSFDLMKEDKDYWPYSEYVRETVVKYFDNLKYAGKYEPIEMLEEFVSQNALEEGINWFRHRLKELKGNYLVYIGKPKSINDCIRKYNRLKTNQYLEITSPFELFSLVKGVVDKTLRNWVEAEGAASLFYDTQNEPLHESRIQKIIQPFLRAQLELLGVTIILREPQKLDDERVDFYVSYGFSPSFVILIETKKSIHGDLGLETDMSEKESYKKLKRYMEGFKADYGILLVFNVKYKTTEWEPFMKKVSETYVKIKNVETIGINAVRSQ